MTKEALVSQPSSDLVLDCRGLDWRGSPPGYLSIIEQFPGIAQGPEKVTVCTELLSTAFPGLSSTCRHAISIGVSREQEPPGGSGDFPASL